MRLLAANFDLSSYCRRINYRDETRADVACINDLIRHQLCHIPFENLDVMAGKRISLVPADIVNKVVHDQRGGYCFELNGIFAMALQALGIPFSLALARPLFYPERRARTHMVVIAKIDGEQWLCDLGFGSYGPRQAMSLSAANKIIDQGGETFQLSHEDNGIYRLQAQVQGLWHAQYEFDLAPQEWVDMVPANHFASTHPDSLFVNKLLVLLHTASGRQILFGDQLKITSDGQTSTRTLSDDERVQVLRDMFGLRVPMPALA